MSVPIPKCQIEMLVRKRKVTYFFSHLNLPWEENFTFSAMDLTVKEMSKNKNYFFNAGSLKSI